MSDRTFAVLIDGGFVKFALKRKQSDPPIDETLLQAFISSISTLPDVQGAALHRVYFYDAKPLTGKVKRPDGEEIDFSTSPLSTISNTQHRAFSRLPYVAMRFGELSNRGWKVRDRVLNKAKAMPTIEAKHLEPNVQQKGVDMRIGLDMASLALKRQVNIIVLVTGDSDLVPAMKLVRREGCQLILLPLGGNLKEAMYDHADVVVTDKSWITYPPQGAAQGAAAARGVGRHKGAR